MTLDSSANGNISMIMRDYVIDIINYLPNDKVGTTSMSAAKQRYEMNDSDNLNKSSEDVVVASALFTVLVFM
jgi:hypothetical protein